MVEPQPPLALPAAPAWRPLAGFRRLIDAAWKVPGDTAEAARLRGDQWRAVVDQLPASVIATTIAIGLLMVALDERAGMAHLGPVLIGLVALNGFNFLLWWHERHQRSAD